MKKACFNFLFAILLLAACDDCKDLACSNHGFCDGGTCTCDEGYEGEACEKEVRERFIGVWSGQSICGGDEDVDEITISPEDGIFEISLSSAESTALVLPATVDGDTFHIAPVIIDFLGTPISCYGEGTLSPNYAGVAVGENYLLNLEINGDLDGTQVIDCEYTLTKE